jgi:hypothetical protein
VGDEEFGDLNEDEIEALLKPQPKEKKVSKHTYNVPGTTRRVKYDPTIRTVYNWFKLPHTMHGICEVPKHDEGRQARNAPKMYYTDDVTGVTMCRWCFVEGRDLL